ncbi:hypothetical protein GOP47_0027516 [Adiantum capillus-veneris]|nr:hypothetical protein GOP47_0027516 [Adiantum capillus-veneris]
MGALVSHNHLITSWEERIRADEREGPGVKRAGGKKRAVSSTRDRTEQDFVLPLQFGASTAPRKLLLLIILEFVYWVLLKISISSSGNPRQHCMLPLLSMQELTANFNLNNTTHERFDVKKKFRKRKNFLSQYGSLKRRKLASPSIRKHVPSNEQVVLSNSRVAERYSLSNAAVNSGLNNDLQASRCTPEHDGHHKNSVKGKQVKHVDLDLSTDLGANNRIMDYSQAAQLDTAEVLCSSTMLPSTKLLEPISKSACDKMQSASDKRVLRPRRVRNKEIKENVPPLADPPLIVGRRVEVYWPLDAAWYHGLISAYDNVQKKHKVSYDDGEEEWLYLAREKFKYEMPSKSESVQSGGKAKESANDGKEGLSMSPLPSSRRQHDSDINSTSNGSPKPIYLSNRKSTAPSTKVVSPRMDAVISKVLFSEGSFEAKATVLRIQKDPKVFSRRHKGNSVGLGRGKTEVDGSVKGEGSFVYGRRQRHEEMSRSQAADLTKNEATKSLKGFEGQHLQEPEKSTKKQKLLRKNDHAKGPAGHPCPEEEHQSTVKFDRCALEAVNGGASLQEVQPKLTNARKRKRQLSNAEAGIAGLSKNGDDGVPESLNTGPGVQTSSEGLHRRTRRKPKIKSLAHTAFDAEAVKDVVGSLVQAKLLSKETDSLCFDSLPPASSREDCNPGYLELGSGKDLQRRESKRGRRYAGGYSRGRGRLRRIMDRRGTLHSIRPSNKCQDSDVATIEDNRLKSSCDQSFSPENSTPFPVSLMDAASTNCPSMLSAIMSMRSVATKRSAFESNFSQCVRQHCVKLGENLERSGSCEINTFYKPKVFSVLARQSLSRSLECPFQKGAVVKESARAQLRVVVQQYLLASCPLQDGIYFKRQFVRSMKLRSHAGAETDFVSCLTHLSVSQNEGMGVHEIIYNWIASVASVGHAQPPIPNPSFKLCRNQGLQFITASVASVRRKSHMDHSTLCLEQISGSFGTESWRLGGLLLPREIGDLLFHGRFSCFHEVRRLLDFYTGLCFDSMLQKWLDSSGSKSVAADKFYKKLHFKDDLGAKKEVMLDSHDWEEESGKKAINDSSFCMGMDFCYLNGLEVPVEGNVFDQISSERNTPIAVKEAYDLPGAITQLDKGTTSNAFMRSSPLSSLNDLAYSASGSSSCSSEECSPKWKTTKMADISFRPQDTVERKGIYREKRYMTSRQHFKKRAGSKRCPLGCEEEKSDMQQLNLSCTANILLSTETRSWREFGARVGLQSRKSEWVVVVQLEGASYTHKVMESTMTSRVNRFTHAMMWKGGDGWILEFCDRMQWMLFKRMHEECGHRNARAAFVKQIPIPFVKQIGVSGEDRPSDDILFGENWPGEVENALDCTKRVYDMDSEDERWLAQRSQRVEEKISMDSFERVVDKLERITYLRQGEMVASDEVTELCESMSSEDAMLAIHHYWSEKRMRKDNALIRYFESSLPRKYQKQLDNWKQRMEELECRFPNVSKEELERQYPQPQLFAFCWPSRGVDADSNVSKRLQRQRSQQKHLNALKYVRTSSFDTSEELQRVSLLRSQRVHDSDWYQATQRGDYWQRKIARDGFSEHLVTGCQVGNAEGASLYEMQANAAAARQSAQMYLLRFDSALQRAVSAIIDFEATYIAELAFMSESATASYEHLVDLRKRINRVMNQFSSLAGKEKFLERDPDLEDGSDDAEHEDDDPSWTVSMHEEAAFSLKEDGTFLSTSERAHLEAWMRSTLRQRAC